MQCAWVPYGYTIFFLERAFIYPHRRDLNNRRLELTLSFFLLFASLNQITPIPLHIWMSAYATVYVLAYLQ